MKNKESMNKPKFEVDFNEYIGDNMILLSKYDVKEDINGNKIQLKEGLEITICEQDIDASGNRDDLFANGYVTQHNKELYKHVKWCCKIDTDWIRHISDL
jgi:hypothetical protein